MSQTFSSPVVVCRPALPGDKADVFEFTKFTWDGEDYIKYVWDYWFSDPDGGLIVAEYAGHAVGMGKLTRLSPGNWWMQGLRVDPRYQDKRIGSLLNDYLVQDWLEHGDGAVRFLTGSEKVKVHSMAERNGFTRIGDRCKFSLPVTNEPPDRQPFTSLADGDIQEAVQLAHQSKLAVLSLGMVDLGWKHAEISADVFKEILDDEECFAYWWRGRRGVLLGWEDVTHDGTQERYFGLSLVACEISDAASLFSDLCRLGGQTGQASIKWYAFLQPQLQEILTAVGFARENEHVNYLFEKRHPTRH